MPGMAPDPAGPRPPPPLPLTAVTAAAPQTPSPLHRPWRGLCVRRVPWGVGGAGSKGARTGGVRDPRAPAPSLLGVGGDAGQVRLAASALLYNRALYTGRDESFEMVQLVSGLARRVHSPGPQPDPETGLRLLLALGKAVHRKSAAASTPSSPRPPRPPAPPPSARRRRPGPGICGGA